MCVENEKVVEKSYHGMFDVAKQVRGTSGDDGFRSSDGMRAVVIALRTVSEEITGEKRRNNRKCKCYEGPKSHSRKFDPILPG